jgi:hypothetical protein
VTDAHCTRRITVSVDHPRVADGIRANGNHTETYETFWLRIPARTYWSGENDGSGCDRQEDRENTSKHPNQRQAARAVDQGKKWNSLLPAPTPNPKRPARKLIEIANSVEAVQNGRIHIELINGPMLFELKATSAEYNAGLKFAIERGWLVRHESGTYVKSTQIGADLFAWRSGSSSLTPDYGICLISASGFVMWALSMTAVGETTIERPELKALSKANEALRTAQNLPAGPERGLLLSKEPACFVTAPSWLSLFSRYIASDGSIARVEPS